MYFSTFITGAEDIVKNTLKKTVKDIEITLILDGLIVYKTSSSIDEIKKCRFLNNSFILIKQFKKEIKPSNLTKIFINDQSILDTFKKSVKPGASFRVMASEQNQTISLDNNILKTAENIIEKKLDFKLNRSLSDYEFWFISRKEKYSLIGIRFTKNTNQHDKLHKGELRSELANLLCIVADIQRNDVILDPFAGYGSIVFECSKYFNANKILAGENDDKVYPFFKKRIKSLNKVVSGYWDGLDNATIKDNSIDKIITDPPWGIYNKNIRVEDFYARMFAEFSRILKDRAILVLLTSRENEIGNTPDFRVLEQYDILVSSKKASIYKLKHFSS